MAQMITFKCKICGGNLTVSPGEYIAECEYCGTTMTIPNIDSERKARMFDRANQYRINCEFDKAYEAFKIIADEDETEAEAYWGMVLSEYGIEYVEDPETHRRKPTCHRAHLESIKKCVNFQMACKYAEKENVVWYQEEAEIIDNISKRIAGIGAKEEPYDIFICYKETDDITNERTEDSVLAQSIYDELVKRNYRVFFSRISLEEKLGKDYEPYIYSALVSAPVMIVVTTSNEHCQAVWVKNEWSRYIGFMHEDDSKTIIPVYKKMSPYDLPEELSRFQAQDMDKIGAIQDLVHAVEKLLGNAKNNDSESVKNLRNEIETRNRKIKKIIVIGTIAIMLGALAIGIIWKVRNKKINSTTDSQYVMTEQDEIEQYYSGMQEAYKNGDYNDAVSQWLEATVVLNEYGGVQGKEYKETKEIKETEVRLFDEYMKEQKEEYMSRNSDEYYYSNLYDVLYCLSYHKHVLDESEIFYGDENEKNFYIKILKKAAQEEIEGYKYDSQQRQPYQDIYDYFDNM